MRENLADTLRLLLVTDDALLGDRDPVAVCQAAVRGGVTAVQLRLKEASDRELLRLARRLMAVLAVPLFINDRLDVALAAGAAGVHLGPDDLAPALARRIVPAAFVIGASVGAAGEIERGAAADYWGIGPLRATRTKGDAGPPLGIEGAKRLLAAAAGRPAVLIGGVQPADLSVAIASGFAGVAVAGSILADGDVEQAARRFAASPAPS
jgi:thiamine-phosphate pyrophosphorylase